MPATGTGAGFQRRFEGSRQFGTFLRQSADIGIEMGIALGQLWEALQHEVCETDACVLSVAAADLPGPPRIGLPMGCPDKDVILTEFQRKLTREREEARGEAIRARHALLPEEAMGSTTASRCRTHGIVGLRVNSWATLARSS